MQAIIIKYVIIAVLSFGTLYYMKSKYDELIETKMELKNTKLEIENIKTMIAESEKQKQEIYDKLDSLQEAQMKQDKSFRSKLSTIKTLPKEEQKKVIDDTYTKTLDCIEQITLGDSKC